MRPELVKREADLRITQRELRHESRELRRFGGVRLQELPSRRQVVEHVGDLHHRALRTAGFDDRLDDPGIDAYLGAALGATRSRPQAEMRHRGDRRQRFTAKAERDDRAEIVGVANLARRMALEAEPRIVRIHPDAVVFDANQLLAAVLGGDGDARGLRIDGVFDQLLDDRGRPFDHFAGGDLVGEILRQPADASHLPPARLLEPHEQDRAGDHHQADDLPELVLRTAEQSR